MPLCTIELGTIDFAMQRTVPNFVRCTLSPCRFQARAQCNTSLISASMRSPTFTAMLSSSALINKRPHCTKLFNSSPAHLFTPPNNVHHKYTVTMQHDFDVVAHHGRVEELLAHINVISFYPRRWSAHATRHLRV
jgi:hypothetical protein